jgi:hypothetical protein
VVSVDLLYRAHDRSQLLVSLFLSGYLDEHLCQLLHCETLQQFIVNGVLTVEYADVAAQIINGFLLISFRDVDAFVDFIEALLVVDVVNLGNVDSHLVALVSARENVLQEPAVSLGKFNAEVFFKDMLETMEEYLSVFIFFLCIMFNSHNQLLPFLLTQLLKQAVKELSPLISIHLSMQRTEIAAQSLSGLPALGMLTLIDPHHVRFVLPEVQRLPRVYLVADRLMKVHVADLAVAVHIELVEDVLELLLSQVQAPVLQVEPQLVLRDRRVLLLVHVAEGLADGLPLKLDFVDNRLFQGAVHQLLGRLCFAFVSYYLVFGLA